MSSYKNGGRDSSRLCKTKGDPHINTEAKTQQAQAVQYIFTWLQCFGTYVSILVPLHVELIPELMAYQATIVRASQDYTGLAWVRCDSPFRRQAALLA